MALGSEVGATDGHVHRGLAPRGGGVFLAIDGEGMAVTAVGDGKGLVFGKVATGAHGGIEVRAKPVCGFPQPVVELIEKSSGVQWWHEAFSRKRRA